MRWGAATPSHSRRRAQSAVLAFTMVVFTFVGPSGSLADTSPLGDDAVAFPAVGAYADYQFADGTQIVDGDDVNPNYSDLIGGPVGDEATFGIATDGTNMFFRFRLADDPNKTVGTFQSTSWIVSLGVGGVQQGVVGVNGKPASTDYVYVSNADGSTVTSIYETPFTSGPTNNSLGAQAVSMDTAGNWFLEFQVPIAQITAATGITATDEIQLFAGSSQAANLSVINKDFMVGSALDYTGLATVTLSEANLSLVKSEVVVAGPNPPQVGQTTTYDISIEALNTGLNSLTAVAIADSVPAGVTITGVSESSGGTISFTGSDITWNPSELDPGVPETAIVTVTVTPTAADVGNTILLNDGATGSGTDSFTGSSASDTSNIVSTAPVAGPILAVTKTFADATAVAGDAVARTFDIEVTNSGNATANNVVIADVVDPGLTVTATNCAAIGGTDSTAGNSVACLLPTLVAPGTATLTVTYTVPSTTDSSTVTNTADVTSTLITAPISGSDTIDITEDVTLGVTKTFTADPVTAGSTGNTFTIQVSNSGTSTADNVQIADVVDAGLSVTGTDCTGIDATVGNSVDCTIASLATGGSVTLTVTYDVPSTTDTSTISNTASVTSDEVPVAVTDTTTVDVTEDVSLAVTKTFTADPVTAGSTGNTFTIQVTNSGTSTADNVQITDVVDAGLTVASTDCSGTDATVGNSVDCTIASLAAGGSVTLTVTYEVPSTTDTSTISNTASVVSDEVIIPVTDVTTVGVIENVVPVVVKTFVADPVIAGSTGNTFTIQVTNSGTSTAENVQITDVVDAGLTVTGTDCSGTDATAGNSVDCTIASLAAGGSVTLTVTFDVPTTTDTSTILNTASVVSDEVVTPVTDTTTVDVTEDVLLAVTKAFTADPVTAGSTGNTFTIQVSNSGASTADNVQITDVVDVGLTVTGTDCTGTDATAGNSVDCTIASLAAGWFSDVDGHVRRACDHRHLNRF